jgi:hypothetical protein
MQAKSFVCTHPTDSLQHAVAAAGDLLRATLLLDEEGTLSSANAAYRAWACIQDLRWKDFPEGDRDAFLKLKRQLRKATKTRLSRGWDVETIETAVREFRDRSTAPLIPEPTNDQQLHADPSPESADERTKLRPSFDKDNKTLTYGGWSKRYPRRATSQFLIFSAFQARQWPDCIHKEPKSDATIWDLNKCLGSGCPIQFYKDGETICWGPKPAS